MSDLLSPPSSSTNIAARRRRRFSSSTVCVWNSLPSFVRTADSFTSFRSHQVLQCSQDNFVASPLSAPLIGPTLTRSFVGYKFVTYLLTYLQSDIHLASTHTYDSDVCRDVKVYLC